MATVLVTGSTDGIGRQTAADLLQGAHRVVLHARNEQRAQDALASLPGAAGVVVGDLTSLSQTREIAQAATDLGPFDAVIHNAGLGSTDQRTMTEDGFERIFQVNVLAPYLLTCLMPRPARLVYLSSGLESQGQPHLDDLQFERRRWEGSQAYADSKLWDVVLAFAVARRWPRTLSNAVDPGWIKTRMGGPSAPDGLPLGADTPVWLATSDEPAATGTGRYFSRRRERRANSAAYDVDVQERFLDQAAVLTGAQLPSA